MSTPLWWKDAVCYQVYPRSFADSNDDGIGDLPGLIGKLDYLKWLGVTALWISPFYPSAQVDWGYDTSDYIAVHPEYGTLEDVDLLIAEAHRRGIRLLLDIVLNHTSDQHPWFQASKSSRDNPYRDWYIWRDGKEDGPPNDWQSIFGGSAWKYDENTGQYYYHFFFDEQPDLNWRNPVVKQELFSVMRFWLDRGIDGFRMDAVGSIFEEEDLRNSDTEGSLEAMFINSRKGVFEDWITLGVKIRHQMNLPEIHPLLREMRALVDEYPDRVLLGEAEDISLYGNGNDELHSVFNFPLVDLLEASHYRRILTERLPQLPPGAWECNTVGNHDRRRSYTLYADGKNDELRARLALAMVMFLEGTPVFYYGEEIGMRNLPPTSLEAMRDVFGTRYYHILREKYGVDHEESLFVAANYMARDGCRTPLQWLNAPNGGFSAEGVATWLPVNPDYAEGVNVEEQMADPASMLHYFRSLISARQSSPVLRRGSFKLVDNGDSPILAYWREYDGERCFVAANTAATVEEIVLPVKMRTFYQSGKATTHDGKLSLAPYAVWIGETTS